MTFLLRHYRSADFDTLWRIDQICFPPGIAYSQMELTGFVLRRNAITIVAEFEDLDGKEATRASGFDPRIAGFAVAHPLRKVGRILTLDVLPSARRAGLGVGLMRECEKRLRARSCTEVYLETAVNNEPAIKLYERLGYQILRILPDYYGSHGLDAFRMGKRLDAAC